MGTAGGMIAGMLMMALPFIFLILVVVIWFIAWLFRKPGATASSSVALDEISNQSPSMIAARNSRDAHLKELFYGTQKNKS